VRPNLLHVTDYGIGLCLQLLNVVESSLGYMISEIRISTREMGNGRRTCISILLRLLTLLCVFSLLSSEVLVLQEH